MTKSSGNALTIVVMTDRFLELSETFVLSEIDALRRAGHLVRVEARGRGNAPRPDVDAAYVDDDRRLGRIEALVRLCLLRPRGAWRDFRSRRRWKRTEAVVPLRTLAPCAMRIRIHGARHIHVHFADRAALDAMRIARILDVPWSLTAHAYDIFMSPRNLVEKIEDAAFVTSGCRYNVEHLRSLVGPAAGEMIQEVVMGVDGARFRRQTPHGQHGTILAVGRLVEKKGFRYLVQAVRLLRDRGRAERLIIVGSGPLEEELSRLISELKLGDQVELVGSRTPEQIRLLLERTDVFVMPCVVAADGDRDSMPVVVKEALAMEVPVVASDEVGLPELVAPEWGRLAAPGDPRAIADATEELLSLPLERRIEMGRAGRAHVLAAANVATETDKVIGLIRRAAK